METQRFKPFITGLGILTFAIAVASAMIALKPKAEKEEVIKQALFVKTAEVALKEQSVYSSFQGEVRAKTNIELVTQVTGKVMSISEKFIEGGEFKAGETLLQIDDADYQVALKSAQASVASAQVDVDVELATAATNTQQWIKLQGRPISEANPLLLNKPQIDRAKARLNAAKAELAAAKLNYDRTKISAPFDGRIMTTSAELGQFLSRGSSVGRVFATDAMEVRIPMTDVQINELGLVLGYSAQSTGGDGLPATVSTVFGSEQRTWKGNLKSVDASLNSQTRLIFATVVVDKPFGESGRATLPLVPGLFVDVRLASPKMLSGLEIPRHALRNGSQVYVYEDQKLRLKSVKPVYTSEDIVILSNQYSDNLLPGERVIVSPVPGAYNGMPIKLPEEIKIKPAVVKKGEADPDENQADEIVLPNNHDVEPLEAELPQQERG